MKFDFSKHALEQMETRKIPKLVVERILEAPHRLKMKVKIKFTSH
jgi:hypothetical protein